MTPQQITEKVLPVLRAVLGNAVVDAESTRERVSGWDSLKHIQIVVAIEQEFGVQLPTEDVIDMDSVPAILRVVQKHVGDETSA